MRKHPYERFRHSDLILRDELAIDRTILANERTILAYMRSALTLVLAGVTFLHFIEAGALRYVGMLCVPLGLALGLFGWLRYRRMDAGIRIVRQRLEEDKLQPPTPAEADGRQPPDSR